VVLGSSTAKHTAGVLCFLLAFMFFLPWKSAICQTKLNAAFPSRRAHRVAPHGDFLRIVYRYLADQDGGQCPQQELIIGVSLTFMGGGFPLVLWGDRGGFAEFSFRPI